MAISESDVRHIALLARLGLDEGRVASVVAELNGILAHMDVLSQVALEGIQLPASDCARVPLREDVPVPSLPEVERLAMAPAARDGFFLVPRLDTHDTKVSSGTPDLDGEEGHR